MKHTRLTISAAVLGALALPATAGAATGNEPAGGAAAGEAIGATVVALVVTGLIAIVIAGHRSGKLPWLDRTARIFERQTGLPGWAALPSAVLGISLLTAVTGMYWDISLHIDNGRDAGPLANPAHYLILIGLYGSLLAGALSIALARTKPSDAAIDLGSGWWAPAGGLLIAACGAFALAGFPLDDLWHRLFGQDVTLWGPTHLMLIGGGSLATLGVMALTTEALAGRRDDGQGREAPIALRMRRVFLVGGFLVALSTFQGEFDFGVPQFRLVFHPMLEMLAAGIGLVAARIYLGRGGAISAVVGFLLIRGFLALTVGVVFGQTTPHFPLYIVEAIIVELVFLRATRLRPVAAGALAGVFIGTIGLAAEWGWSHVWMPIPWPSALLPEAAVVGLLAAVAGGAVGGFIGAALVRPRPFPPLRAERLAALAAGLVLIALVGWALPLSTDGPRTASVTLRDVPGDGGRSVAATIRLSPRDSAKDVDFLNVTAWQGGGSVLDPLERVSEGVYRTTKPIPVHDGWKAMVRLQEGAALVSAPLYLPRDRAIPAPEVPALATFTREFQADHQYLQRERKEGVPGALTVSAYLTVLAIALSLMALIAWVLIRIESSALPPEQRPRRPRRVQELVQMRTRRTSLHVE
jgi:hypothetical protein